MQEGYLSPANTSRIHGVKKNALGLRSSVHHQATELEDIQIVKELGRNVITGSGIAWSICVDVITLLGHGPIRPRTMVHKLTAFVISPSLSPPAIIQAVVYCAPRKCPGFGSGSGCPGAKLSPGKYNADPFRNAPLRSIQITMRRKRPPSPNE